MSGTPNAPRRGFSRFPATLSLIVGLVMGAILISFPQSKPAWIALGVLVLTMIIVDGRGLKSR